MDQHRLVASPADAILSKVFVVLVCLVMLAVTAAVLYPLYARPKDSTGWRPPPHAQRRLNRALQYFESGEHAVVMRDFALAEAKYRQAIQTERNYPQAWARLGDLLFEQQRSDEALSAYREGLVPHPERKPRSSLLGDPSRWVFLESRLRYGVLCERAGKMDEANSAYLPVIMGFHPHRAYPFWPIKQTLKLKTVAHIAVGLYRGEHSTSRETCIPAFREAVQSEPNQALPHFYLAWALQDSSLRDAAAEYDKAASLGSGAVKKAASEAKRKLGDLY